MNNVLSEEKKQQVIALGKLGWSLRRIERETGVRRETAGVYLKAARVAMRQPGLGQWSPKPTIGVTGSAGSNRHLRLTPQVKGIGAQYRVQRLRRKTG